ncbi:MAG: c-type cytochrome [Pseudomonadota bacterium]
MARVLAMVLAGVAAVGMAGGAVAAEPGPVERGRYLVEGVGLCADCHTPRDATGRPDGAKALHGSAIGFAPLVPVPGWADTAPALAGGRPGWTRSQMIDFLTTGVRPGGEPARPPMPPYRLNRQDAEAVAVYLESLPAPRR